MHHQWESGGECVAWRRFADDASVAFVSATKVSAVARSAAGDVLATADELGAVRLFKNPCPEAGAASARYAAEATQPSFFLREWWLAGAAMVRSPAESRAGAAVAAAAAADAAAAAAAVARGERAYSYE